jgi:hypothetical protein
MRGQTFSFNLLENHVHVPLVVHPLWRIFFFLAAAGGGGGGFTRMCIFPSCIFFSPFVGCFVLLMFCRFSSSFWKPTRKSYC